MPFKDNDKARILVDGSSKSTGSGGRLLFDDGNLFDAGLLFDAAGDISLVGEKARIFFENKKSHISLMQD